MDKRHIRIGDWLIDPNTNWTTRATITEIEYSKNFVHPYLRDTNLLKSGFKKEEVENVVVYFRGEKEICVRVFPEVEGWVLSISTPKAKVESQINTVGEFQHFLSDCGIEWEINL